ncbi:MAG: ABC transporter ATP-binding protein [Desulfurococcales archaeon]|nr:ABC transporter ATP-binding protein [Desulfurococcales archaeon]
MAFLEIKGVTKKFRGLIAVNRVSFNVEKGEIVGLIGPNGAGKTTLFNVLTGVYKPDEGRIVYRGMDITGLKPHRIARLGIAKTHQVPRPFSDLTVIENVVVSALFGGRIKSTEEAVDKAIGVLRITGLEDKAELPAKVLNVQEKKRLELAKALSMDPELLLLDEVLAGLTPSEIEEMLELLRKLRSSQGITMIMVEHVMHAVMNIADRIVVLHFGRKIAEGTPEEVANNEEVITAYLGDPELALKLVKRGA